MIISIDISITTIGEADSTISVQGRHDNRAYSMDIHVDYCYHCFLIRFACYFQVTSLHITNHFDDINHGLSIFSYKKIFHIDIILKG